MLMSRGAWAFSRSWNHPRSARAGWRHADSPVGEAAGQDVVDEHRLVGAMEGADAEMDDAGGNGGSVVAGPPDCGGEAAEGGVIQHWHGLAFHQWSRVFRLSSLCAPSPGGSDVHFSA